MTKLIIFTILVLFYCVDAKFYSNGDFQNEDLSCESKEYVGVLDAQKYICPVSSSIKLKSISSPRANKIDTIEFGFKVEPENVERVECNVLKFIQCELAGIDGFPEDLIVFSNSPHEGKIMVNYFQSSGLNPMMATFQLKSPHILNYVCLPVLRSPPKLYLQYTTTCIRVMSSRTSWMPWHNSKLVDVVLSTNYQTNCYEIFLSECKPITRLVDNRWRAQIEDIWKDKKCLMIGLLWYKDYLSNLSAQFNGQLKLTTDFVFITFTCCNLALVTSLL